MDYALCWFASTLGTVPAIAFAGIVGGVAPVSVARFSGDRRRALA